MIVHILNNLGHTGMWYSLERRSCTYDGEPSSFSSFNSQISQKTSLIIPRCATLLLVNMMPTNLLGIVVTVREPLVKMLQSPTKGMVAVGSQCTCYCLCIHHRSPNFSEWEITRQTKSRCLTTWSNLVTWQMLYPHLINLEKIATRWIIMSRLGAL